MTRALPILVVLLIASAACQDLGPPRRERASTPDETSPRPPTDRVAVRCARATIALSADLRASASLDGAHTESQPDGRVTISGEARLRLARLDVRCDTLEITPCEGTDRFLLLASGDVAVRRGETTISGRTLVIDGDVIEVAGQPRLDVAWRTDGPTPNDPPPAPRTGR